MTQPEIPSLISGNILEAATHFVITGGSFVGSQNNVTTTMSELDKSLQLLYETAAPNAILNCGGRADEVNCFPGTREEVLAMMEAWIGAAKGGNNSQRGIFWLSGPAGAGKSAIVQTLAERCMARNLPMANFFFFRGDYSRSHARSVVATLVCQLLESYPKLKPLIRAVLQDKPMIFNQSLHAQFKHLVQNPVHAIREVSIDQQPIVMLIDGLDECDSAGKLEQKVLLQVLHQLVSCENSPFLVLVASRREPHLTMTFNEIGPCADSIFLDETYRPSDDIRLFVVAEFVRIKNTHHLGCTMDKHWPSESNINAIVNNSSGQFIYAATVLRFIANSSASPEHSLDKVLGLRPVRKSSPFAELDAVYTHILSQVEDWDATKDILAAQLFLFMSMPNGLLRARRLHITLHTMLRPIGYNVSDLASYTSDLTAIARFDHEFKQLEFYHASLPDFLDDKIRSGQYYIDMSAFISRVAPAHIRGILDFDSLLASFFIATYINQPTSSLDEVLTTCPPRFQWVNTEKDAHPYIKAFLKMLQKLYFHGNNQLYLIVLRHWLVWFRDMNFILRDEDLKGVAFANEIWNEIIAIKVGLVEGEPSSGRPCIKKAPFWKKILRVT